MGRDGTRTRRRCESARRRGRGRSNPTPAVVPRGTEKKKRGRGCLTALAIAAVVIIGIIIIVTVASSGGDDDDSASSSASDDGKSQVEEVTVTSCDAPDAIGVVYAKGAAENTSSKRSDYIIEVTVEHRPATRSARVLRSQRTSRPARARSGAR